MLVARCFETAGRPGFEPQLPADFPQTLDFEAMSIDSRLGAPSIERPSRLWSGGPWGATRRRALAGLRARRFEAPEGSSW